MCGIAGYSLSPASSVDRTLAARALLAGIADIPTNALLIVAVVGIPLLVVAGLTPRWSLRALMAAAIVALLGAVAWSVGSASDVGPARVTLVIASAAVVVIALVVWGTLSAWSWIVAALAYQGFAGLRNAAYGPVWQDRGAGALTLLVASALVALIARQVARTRQSS